MKTLEEKITDIITFFSIPKSVSTRNGIKSLEVEEIAQIMRAINKDKELLNEEWERKLQALKNKKEDSSK